MAARCVAPAPPMRRSRPGALARRPSSASPLLSARGSTKPRAPVRAQYKLGITLGEWCEENGEYGDKLMEEWYDPDRTVDGVTRGTKYRALWRCSSGCTVDGEKFTWEARVSNRTRTKRRAGCPGCSGHVPTDANNLRKWCQDNGEYGQKLAAEWAEPDVNMKDVTPASAKKLTWRCSSGCTVDGEPFTWVSTASHRTSNNRTGCPGCGGHGRYVQLTDQNNLLKWCQDNGEYGQKLIEEWAEPDVNMKDVTPGTNKKHVWRCSSGCTVDGEPFTWESTLNSRTCSIRTGCPGCGGHGPSAQLTDQNNLLKWCQDNKEYGQKLIEEWAEPDVNMKDVMPGTNKKHLWRCSSGCTVDGEQFTWEAIVDSRTCSDRCGCPGCSPAAPIDLKKRLGKVAR